MSSRTLNKKYRPASIALLLAIVLCAGAFATMCVPFSAAQKSKNAKPRAKAPAVPAAPAVAPVPFKAGELLEYRVLFSKYAVNAAKVETSVVEQRDFFGHRAWHFRAIAHTMDTTRVLFAIDDQFDSYTDAATLESRQYETYLNEMGEKQTEVFHFLPEGQPPRAHVAGVVVTPGTRDPLGAAYALRGVDWAQTPEFRAPVYDGHDVYDMRARLDVPAETVAVAAGNFSVAKISIRLFQHGKEVPGTSFTAWLANDAARTPVLLVAEMPLGNFRVELVSAVQ